MAKRRKKAASSCKTLKTLKNNSAAKTWASGYNKGKKKKARVKGTKVVLC